MRIVLTILLFLSVLTSYSQARRIRKAEAQQQSPTTLDPLPREQNIPKQARKRADTKGPTYNSEKQYYDRVDAFAKTRRKNEKMSMSPQYSDPSYFGHKRPPKKRPANKMKFCKECGIRH
jgi:hypothetical protein